MNNKNIEERINNMKLEELALEKRESENKIKSDDYVNMKQIKFNETFGIFYDYLKKSKNIENNLLALLYHNKEHKNDTKQIMANIDGVTINVIPKYIEIINSSSENDQILLGICFEPYNTESIDNITWFIENDEICSFTVKNNIPLESDSFNIPKKVYFRFLSKNEKVQVKTVVTSYKYCKYHYLIKINYNEADNEYKFTSIKNPILHFNNKKFCCLDIYGNSILDFSISKNELFENITSIENDLDNILSRNIGNNKFLKFKEYKQCKVMFSKFESEEEYSNKSYSYLNDMIITDYPKYMARIIQNSSDIEKLNKSWFEYILLK